MKKLSIKKGVQCMACLECVRACSNAYYKEFHPDKAALKIVQRNDTVKPMVCVQCGKCAAACPSGAITQNPKGVWMISRKLCTGCGKCVEACPFGLIVKDENTPYSSKWHVPWSCWRSWRNKQQKHKPLCRPAEGLFV